MDWHRFVRAQLGDITGDAARDADIVEELAQHMGTRFDELLGDGVTEQEALDRLATELKGTDLGRAIRRADRVRPAALVQPAVSCAGLLRDARYALRALARAPRFTASVIATLGIRHRGHDGDVQRDQRCTHRAAFIPRLGSVDCAGASQSRCAWTQRGRRRRLAGALLHVPRSQ